MSEVEVFDSIDPEAKILYPNFKGQGILKPGIWLEIFDPFFEQDLLGIMENLNPIGKKILNYLKQIPGIATIFLKNREIMIIKGIAFEWEEIIPRVVYALEVLSLNPDAELLFEEKEFSPTCKVQTFLGDPKVRIYHFNRVVVSNSKGEMDPRIDQALKGFKNLEMFFENFSFGRHSIFIHKKPCNSWEEVEKFLQPALNRLCGAPVKMEYVREDIGIIVFCEYHDGLSMEDIIGILKSNQKQKPRLPNREMIKKSG